MPRCTVFSNQLLTLLRSIELERRMVEQQRLAMPDGMFKPCGWRPTTQEFQNYLYIGHRKTHDVVYEQV